MNIPIAQTASIAPVPIADAPSVNPAKFLKFPSQNEDKICTEKAWINPRINEFLKVRAVAIAKKNGTREKRPINGKPVR